MGLSLHYNGHSHGGKNHSHEENINVRAALIHVIGDFIQSFGVLVAALIIYFRVTIRNAFKLTQKMGTASICIANDRSNSFFSPLGK